MTHPLLDLGGSGALVHLAPANGFPPDTYLPALAPVFPSHRVVSLPPRAMWPGIGAAPPEPESWVSLGEDLLAGMRLHRLPPVIGIGHSFGAVASILAAVREPARFRALALLDPTILPPPMMDAFREQRRKGEILSRPLVQAARKRRDRFATAAEAFEYWRGKPLFHDWPDTALHDYVRAMLRPDQGGGFGLAWRREWEAHYYESFFPDSWAEVGKLDPKLPMLVVGGAVSDTFLPESAALMRELLPHATHVTLPGRGHLFPQAAPGETGKILRGWLASL
jgi:pimeloyl-ACP methyl ester carboxylesterase